jgi:DNA-binding transcriptional MerR regulator
VVNWSYTTTLLLDVGHMETFNTGLVMRITGASARQLDYWNWTGFVQPSDIAGRKRKYSLDDVIRIAAVMHLKEAGLSLQTIRKALTKLRQHHQDPLRELKLVAYLGNVYVYRSAEEAYRTVDGQSTYIFMDLGKIAEQTEALLESFS